MKRWPLIVTAGPAAMPARAIPVFTLGWGHPRWFGRSTSNGPAGSTRRSPGGPDS